MINATQIRKGMLIKIDAMPFIVLKVSHVTPGKGKAFVQCVFRNLQNGLSKEVRFRSSDRVEETELELVEMEYIYSAMLLHSAGQKVTEANVKKVLTAAGVKADDARIKALTASLEGVNIDEAIKTAAVPVAAAAAPAPSGEAPAEGKKEEKKKEEKKEEVSEEEAAAGLGALFD